MKPYDELTHADARTDLMALMKHNTALSAGDTVEVRWTSSGYAYAAVGTVTKVNACSAKVAISAGTPDGNYPAGFEITQDLVNMRTMLRWSWSNAILPVQSGPCPEVGCGVVGGEVVPAEMCATCRDFFNSPASDMALAGYSR